MFLCHPVWKARSRQLLRGAYHITKSLSTSSVNWSEYWQPLFDRKDFPKHEYDAFRIAMQKKKKLDYERSARKRKFQELPAQTFIEGTSDEVLVIEAASLLSKRQAKDNVSEKTGGDDRISQPRKLPVESGTEYELEVVMLSSTGDGLAYTPSGDHVVVVPFTVPGDTAIAKVYKIMGDYSLSDFVKIVKPSSLRDGVTPQCQYFAECGGCQLQMISYEDQLKHKKTIVEKAFRSFSGLPSEKIPSVLDTMGSPLQYGYRTKLSPHFDKPRQRSRRTDTQESEDTAEIPKIGFNRRGTKKVMDIETCAIGTDILNEGMAVERSRTIKKFDSFKRGATLLLRESTVRQPIIHDETNVAQDADTNDLKSCDFDAPPTSSDLQVLSNGNPVIKVTHPTYIDRKTYVSDMAGLATEYIGHYKFVNRAGSFFQNNNSILRPFTAYVRDQVVPRTHTTEEDGKPESDIKYLLDAYCGSGLFTITLSRFFSSALGIDIDRRGIEAARLNAEANSIANAGFIDADAANLFADVPYPPDQTLVVIDPPRRGASEDFLRQLCKFKAKRVIYISCNVHTQARDVGMIVRGFDDLEGGCKYEIESLKGFDFFPQTGHVEGCCVLHRVDDE